MDMDMRISGAGKIPAGEYNKISVSGSGRLYGQVRCTSFASSGSNKGESIQCTEDFKISGKSAFSEDVRAKTLRISGSFTCKGNLQAESSFSCSGSAKCEKSMRSGQVRISGALAVGENLEAESLQVSGAVNCKGLIRADCIEIKADSVLTVGQIEGRHIQIRRKRFSLIPKRGMHVTSAIAGDTVALEYVSCPSVTGRVVTLGKGCRIDLVRYSEAVEIAPGAIVGNTEKI